MKLYNLNFTKTLLLLIALLVFSPVFSQEEQSNISKNRFYVGVNGSLSFAMPSNSIAKSEKQWASKSQLTVNPAVNVLYKLGDFGVGLGLQFGSYNYKYSINNFKFSTRAANKWFEDQDGDRYYPIFEINSLDETTFIKTIDIPLHIEYLKRYDRFGILLSVGANLSMVQGVSYSLEGVMTRKAFYPKYNVTLGDYGDDIPEYNIYIDKQFDGKEKMDLLHPKSTFSGFFSVGVQYDLTNQIAFRANAIGSLGFTDLSPNFSNSFNEFHSSLHLGKVSLNTFAIQLGILYGF